MLHSSVEIIARNEHAIYHEFNDSRFLKGIHIRWIAIACLDLKRKSIAAIALDIEEYYENACLLSVSYKVFVTGRIISYLLLPELHTFRTAIMIHITNGINYLSFKGGTTNEWKQRFILNSMSSLRSFKLDASPCK